MRQVRFAPIFYLQPNASSFQMDAIPLKYQPGSLLTVKFSESHTVTFIPEKVLIPFSTSQVLVVRPQTIPPGLSPPLFFDSWYILKIYDPRYFYRERRYCRLDGRLLREARPWSLEAELKAVAYRHSLRKMWEDNFLFDFSDDLEPEVVWELIYYRMAKWGWEREVDAYQVLNKTSLAGVDVPRFYGAGDLVLEEKRRGIVPRALVVEYIEDAVSLHDLQRGGDLGFLKAWHVKAFKDVFERINKVGVTHERVNSHNLLILPKRVVVVDFGGASVRPQGCTNKQWARRIDGEGDSVAVGKVFKWIIGEAKRIIGEEEFERLMSSEVEGGDPQSNRANFI